MSNTLTLAFIGNGKSTNRYHLPFLLQRQDRFFVKTIYDRSLGQTAPKWDPVDSVHYTSNVNDVLTDPEIDFVVVTTMHHSHYEYAKKVLLAGKHCILEKPFTETAAQAEELFALAKARGLLLEGYQNRRFDSDFLTTQSVITSGKLGQLLELEMHFDYYRPEVPLAARSFSTDTSYLYGHACHTLDQAISHFGAPDRIHYDVRQLLGKDRMNDYFDLDLYYDNFKVSVKSSYFRVKPRPSFVLYGTRGMWIKETPDRQEEHLKLFYLPDHSDFGLDRPQDYGTLTYYDVNGQYYEEKVSSLRGDYGRYYDHLYETLVNGAPPLVTPEQTLLVMRMLEEGIRGME